MNIKTEYNVGDSVLVDLGKDSSKPERLTISSKSSNAIGAFMYGFEGKGEVRVGANFIYDEKAGRYPRPGECVGKSSGMSRLSRLLTKDSIGRNINL